MTELRKSIATILLLITVAAGLVGCAQSTGGERPEEVPQAPDRILPWEWWRDLVTLSVVPNGDRVVMRSSHCPSGCEFDRHSAGDSRFIEVRDDGEGVIFKADGAGAVTRIWMVMGEGRSEPLDEKIRLRVRIDGRDKPVVDLALPELFAGRTAPFLSPLVADRTRSGGGHVSYVPVPFRDGCEITLVGADDAQIWFQVVARMVSDPYGVRSFTGGENLDGLRSTLQRAGSDPWQSVGSTNISGSAMLAAGEGKVVATLDGPDMVNGLIVRTKPNHWPRLGFRFTFDDREPQLVAMTDLFGLFNTSGGLTTSLFVGADGESDLYCYFPMPFFEGATIELMRRPVEGPRKVRVSYAIRTAGFAPPDEAGYFGVQVRATKKSEIGEEIPLLDLDGRGKWVGLVTDLSVVGRRTWSFFEADERVAIDGEDAPSWHGTGVEDFFNGGFYFYGPEGRPAPFGTALAGAPFFHRPSSRAVMYRLLLGDAVVFHGGITASLEPDPVREVSLRSRTVAYYYAAPMDDDGEAAVAEE